MATQATTDNPPDPFPPLPSQNLPTQHNFGTSQQRPSAFQIGLKPISYATAAEAKVKPLFPFSNCPLASIQRRMGSHVLSLPLSNFRQGQSSWDVPLLRNSLLVDLRLGQSKISLPVPRNLKGGLRLETGWTVGMSSSSFRMSPMLLVSLQASFRKLIKVYFVSFAGAQTSAHGENPQK
ncbi:hypothetical protein QQ045_017229 [Rhodiola kirilowii]